MLFVTLLVNCLSFFAEVEGYLSGAPPDVCGTLMPGHGFNSQTSAPPFNISLSTSSYTAGQALQGFFNRYVNTFAHATIHIL